MLRRFLLSLPLALALPALAGQTCPANNVFTTLTADLTDNGDGTVTHSKTGLMWKQCAEGLSGPACATGSASPLTWAGALAVAKNSAFAVYSDWRLPNQKELASIVENGCNSPAINATRFPNTPSTKFWSSTSVAGGGGRRLICRVRQWHKLRRQ